MIKPIPVNKEVAWDKTKTIMSKTDPRGVIEYANDAFIEVSGYEEHELMGQPQNIVRHPDMPKVIFKILWDNLKAGRNMHAIIKNMAKNGRYYWVITDFEVKLAGGDIANYYGRRRAVPQQVISDIIEPLYEKLIQIEKVGGIAASEKYFNGFLEEKGKDYNTYIKGIITAIDKGGDKKGFFARFFD